MVVGGGLTGLWAALLARQRRSRARGRAARGRADRLRRLRAQRRLHVASLTHGIENGVARWPDEMPQLERLGARELRSRSRTRWCATASMRASRRRASSPLPPPLSGGVHPGDRGDRPRLRLGGRGARRRGGARRGPLADLPRRGLPARLPRGWSTPPGWPGGWRRRRGRRACRLYESSPATRPGARRRRRAGNHERGPRARPPRGPGHQRLPAAGARDPPLRGARVGLRAGDRAAQRASSASRSAGSAARAWPTSATSSTTTG